MPRSPLRVRPASPEEVETVAGLLTEASRWVEERGLPNGWPVPFPPGSIAGKVANGEVYLALLPGGEAVGTVSLQWEDPAFWGERPPDAGYVHRLAVRPAHFGEGWGRRLLEWAADRSRERGRRYLRMDCLAENVGLRRYYGSLGFAEKGSVVLREKLFTRLERRLAPKRPGATSSPSGARRPSPLR